MKRAPNRNLSQQGRTNTSYRNDNKRSFISNWLVQLKHLKAVYSTNILVNQRFPARKKSLQKNVTGVTYYKAGFTWRCVWRNKVFEKAELTTFTDVTCSKCLCCSLELCLGLFSDDITLQVFLSRVQVTI